MNHHEARYRICVLVRQEAIVVFWRAESIISSHPHGINHSCGVCICLHLSLVSCGPALYMSERVCVCLCL